MGKTILLTGSNGFVGSFVLKEFVKHDFKIIILLRKNSNLYRIENKVIENKKIKKIKIDNYNEISKIFEQNKIDYVAHLATNYIKEDNYKDISALIESNISFPAHLLELSRKHNIKGFINTGTFFEYDQSESMFNEETNINPFNFYAKSKQMFQNLLESYSSDFSLTTLKLFSPYGPMDNDKVIPYIIKSMMCDKKLYLSNPNESCDFTYVKDISYAFLKSIKHIDKNDIRKNINICSGSYTKLSEILSLIESILDKKAQISYKSHDHKSIRTSSNIVAKNELGWEPQTKLVDGLTKTVEYYKNYDGT